VFVVVLSNSKLSEEVLLLAIVCKQAVFYTYLRQTAQLV